MLLVYITLVCGVILHGFCVEQYNTHRFSAKGEVITKVSIGNAKDIDTAVETARIAFKNSWGLKVPGYERGRMLSKLADLIEQHQNELAAIEALNAGKFLTSMSHATSINLSLGKVFTHAVRNDMPSVLRITRYFSGWADKNHGQTIEV